MAEVKSKGGSRIQDAMNAAYGKAKGATQGYFEKMKVAHEVGFSAGWNGRANIPTVLGASDAAAIGYRQGVQARKKYDKAHARLSRAERRNG